MRDRFTIVLFVTVFAFATVCDFLAVPASSQSAVVPDLIAKAHRQRQASTDLAVGGDLNGLPAGTTRYFTREDLLALPQVTYTVTDDTNFKGPTEITGVLLEDLMKMLASSPKADLVTAICGDQYQSHYPRSYLAAHHPLLVLKLNGQPPERWPKDAEGHGLDMGPYMISHRQFKPSFKILAHEDEPQVPWGVVRLEFRNEHTVLSAIAPRGPKASNPAVEAGYRIAQQNCFRCHNAGSEGGQKARRPWLVLSAWAEASPDYFAAYVRNPQSENPQAQMYANPGYDHATLQALIAYFRTFSIFSSPAARGKP